MDVRVLKARYDHAAFQIDDIRLRADVRLGALVRADKHDTAVVIATASAQLRPPSTV